MLAQSFKSAADLDITEPQRSALMKTLMLLETGKLQYRQVSEESDDSDEPTFCENFNMRFWRVKHPCGTIACIGGTAELIGDVTFGDRMRKPGLAQLFWPWPMNNEQIAAITPAQAATALRSYLTIGDARWDLAVAEEANA